MPLTDTIIKNVKYTRDDGKPQREYDEGGLYLEITPKGKKKWQLKYRRPVTGKESRLSFGMYPLVTLKEARTKRDEAKKLLAQQIDPGEAKKEDKRLAILQSANTFQAIANEWLSKQVQLAEVTRNKNEWLLSFAFADFGHKPITDVTSPDLLAVCRKLEAKSNIETAHRVRSKCGQVFRYAIATGHATYDPSQALRGALQPVVVNHRPAITDPALVATLIQAISGYQGYPTTISILKLAPLVFVRPGELRQAKWADINFEKREWSYYVSKTKSEGFIVPLSRQAIAILTELQTMTGNSAYLFPSVRTNSRPMSENTVNAALRRLGYASDEMCGHGFRAMARTILEEKLGYRIEVIEMQLAHAVRDANGRAYNRTTFIDQRHKMMQHWADYLDGLQSRNVVNVRFGGSAG